MRLQSGPNEQTIFEAPGTGKSAVYFPSPERAVKSLAYMCDYSDFVRRESKR